QHREYSSPACVWTRLCQRTKYSVNRVIDGPKRMRFAGSARGPAAHQCTQSLGYRWCGRKGRRHRRRRCCRDARQCALRLACVRRTAAVSVRSQFLFVRTNDGGFEVDEPVCHDCILSVSIGTHGSLVATTAPGAGTDCAPLISAKSATRSKSSRARACTEL